MRLVSCLFISCVVSMVSCKFPELPPLDIDAQAANDGGNNGDGGAQQYTLTVNVDGPGLVSSDPAGISCSAGMCTMTFPAGEEVALVAAPGVDASFVGFTGACSGAVASCTVAMTADRAVMAAFQSFECKPNTTTCSQQVLNECDANGVSHPTVCGFGCAPSGTRCYDLEPSNVGMSACLDAATVEADAAIPDGATIDTDTGAIVLAGGGAVNVPSETIAASAGGVGVRCFRANNITLGTVSVVGSAALAIAANGTITITGNVSVSASAWNVPGPGHYSSGANCIGGSGTNTGYLKSGGGAGGGFGTDGRNGGGGGNGASGGTAGPAGGNPELVPLRGGCSGGGSGVANSFRNAGGAVQMVSRREITLMPNSGISANGGGGGWDGTGSTHLTPGGGGSGGGILLEAPQVSAPSMSFLVANGGGGGGAVGGTPGQISVTGAPGGGPGDGTLYGAGGRGGSRSDNPTGGSSHAEWSGGGGGGSVGRIRVNAYNVFVPDAAAIVSPAPTTGAPARR